MDDKRIKRKDLGIAGAVVVIAEAITNFTSSRSISHEVIKIKDEIKDMKVEREQYFVRKTELSSVSKKLDKLNDQLIRVDDKIASIKKELKLNFATMEYEDSDLIGCSEIAPPKTFTLGRL
jgi:uncharacterized protein YydD (DUF2326 family)